MKISGKCLIVDEMHPSIIPLLENIGLAADYYPFITREETAEIIHQYQGLIVRSKIHIDHAILGLAVNLKFIARAGAGLDQIDVDEAKKRNIQIFNAPEGNRDAVAEHTLGLVLCLLNKIHRADLEIRSGSWKRSKNRGGEIMGKTVSVFGYGHMGQAFAQRLSSFGCNILAYDKYKTGFSSEYVKEANLEDIFNETDILSLHIPLSSETKGMLNIDFLRKFRKPIYLINTARGEIIPLKALREGLKTGIILGAGLDVLETEKISADMMLHDGNMNFLTKAENVVFTPHVAGWSNESYVKINEVLVTKIAAASFI